MHIMLICADDDVWAVGMRSISATLRAAGHNTTMVFAGTPTVPVGDSLLGEIASLAADADIIGVSSMSRASERAKSLLAGVRRPGRLVVWGGMHPTLYPQDCVQHADLVCRGEGEGFMVDLAERLGSHADIADIPNAAYLRDGQLVLNDLRPLIADLDTLPFPDFLFEEEWCLTADAGLAPHHWMRHTDYVLFSGSRGCNNSCTYCSNSQLKAIYRGDVRYARKMSTARFVACVRECRQLFAQVKRFYFTDEDFFARPVEEMRELAEALPREVGVPFEVMASPRQISEEKVALAAKAGMWRIDVGLESGSERTRREVFNRYVDDDTQLKAAAVISGYRQVTPYYFLILGNPYEERKDLIEGIKLLRKMPPGFFLRAYNLVFIPGTQLFDRACADGIIANETDSAFEIDFIGFDPSGHDWKLKNLYLNALMALMVGKSTRLRLGWMPRFLLSPLTSEPVVEFCDRHQGIGGMLVWLAQIGLKARRAALIVANKVLPDRRMAYGLRYLVRRRPSADTQVVEPDTE